MFFLQQTPATPKATLMVAFLMELFASIFGFFVFVFGTFVNFKTVSFASNRQLGLDPKTQFRFGE